MKRNSLYRLILSALICLGLSWSSQVLRAQSTNFWTGSSNGLWSVTNNWIGGIPGGTGANGSTRIWMFGTNGNTVPNSTNDINSLGGFRIFFNSGATNFTLFLKPGTNGPTLNDFGQNQPQIQNDSTNVQTIDMSFKLQAKGITIAANQAANINPTSGDLVFTTNCTVSLITNTQLRFFSTAGHSVTFNGPLTNTATTSNACVLSTTSSGGPGPTIIFANTQDCTNTFIASGTVRLAANNVTVAPITLGDTLATNAAATFLLMDNGFTNSSPLVIQAIQPTLTNSKTIGNTTNGTGAAVFTGPISLGTNLTTVATTNGALVFNGNVDFQNPAGGTSNRNLIVSGAGNTTFGGNFTNGTTGISVFTKTNSGTLALNGTSNSVRILFNHGGGVISITNAGAIGIPTGANYPDKFNFTTNATLRVSNSITLGSNVATNNNAGFRINGGSTATFDVALNSAFTIDGGIIDIPSSGSGSMTKAGLGTLVLNQSNSYSGTTTVSAGSLKVNNTAGSATGSGAVIVNASGTLTGPGSISGAVTVDGIISPGSSPGTITTGSETWDNGGHYSWDINNVAGTSGADPGQDLITVNGALNIAATSGGFSIDINGLNLSDVPGAVTGFANTSRYSWTILHTTGGISGFASNAFTLNAANFSNNNALGLGIFTVSLTNAGNDLALNFIGNTAPVAGTANYSRPRDLAFKIKISDLLTNATDANGDAISLVSVGSPSTNGATISNDTSYVYYTPAGTNANVTDSFTYTVADAYGATNQGYVIVTIAPDTNAPSVNIVSITSLSGGNKQIDFAGIPGHNYLVQATTNLTPTIIWTTLGTNQAGTNGLFQFIDTNANTFSNRFYRTAQP